MRCDFPGNDFLTGISVLMATLLVPVFYGARSVVPQRLSEASYNKKGVEAKAATDAIMDGEGYMAFMNAPQPDPL